MRLYDHLFKNEQKTINLGGVKLAFTITGIKIP